ncbi:MAG: hypothetical protein ACFCU9_15755 [Cyanophyceae cyanobacterium]|jgi:hypothetical protein
MYRLGSWLFLLGSMVFSIDGLVGIHAEVTWRTGLYLVGSLIFGAGCLCFVVDAERKL